MQKARSSAIFAVALLTFTIFQAARAGAEETDPAWQSYALVAHYEVVQDVFADFTGDPGVSDRTKLRLYKYDQGVRRQMITLATAVQRADTRAVRRLLPMAVGLLRAQVQVVSLERGVDARMRAVQRRIAEMASRDGAPTPVDWHMLTVRIADAGDRIAAATVAVRQRMASLGQPQD